MNEEEIKSDFVNKCDIVGCWVNYYTIINVTYAVRVNELSVKVY